MKTEDIDKKIGMPDVDKEWARFEREVIGKESKTNRRSVYSSSCKFICMVAPLSLRNVSAARRAKPISLADGFSIAKLRVLSMSNMKVGTNRFMLFVIDIWIMWPLSLFRLEGDESDFRGCTDTHRHGAAKTYVHI